MYKPFQIVLVLFLVIFTAAGLVLFISPITSLVWSTSAGGADTNGIVAISGGVSNKLFNLMVIAVMLLAIAGIYLISRRSKLR